MKKIISLFLVLAMVACMGITSFAASEGIHITLTVDKPELVVGSGTQEVLVTLSFVADSDTVVSCAQTGFNFGELTMVASSYNDSALTASIPRGDAINEAAAAYTYMDTVGFSTPTWAAGSVYSVTAKVSVDTTTAATYTIGVDSSADALGADYMTTVINGGKDATATITVAAAGPVATAKTVEEAVEVNAGDITIGEQKYTNVAVFDGSIVIPAPQTGESVTDAGIKMGVEIVKHFPDISGGGSVTYKVLFTGITDDQAAELGATLKTFYTGLFFE